MNNADAEANIKFFSCQGSQNPNDPCDYKVCTKCLELDKGHKSCEERKETV